MPIGRVTLDDALMHLHALETELRGWGLHQGQDRLGEAVAALAEVKAAVDAGKAKELEERADFENLVWASVEGLEFAAVYQGLHPMDRGELEPLFTLALEGPLHPGQELAGTTARGRNTMFQLRLGAGLRGAGARIGFEDPSDVNLELPGGRLLIECKRPYKGQNVLANIEKARGQLHDRLANCEPGTGGLVAISVSRVLNPGPRLLVAGDESGLHRLADDLQLIHRESGNSGNYDRLVDLRLVGVLHHGYTPAYVRDPGLLTFASQTVVYMSGPATQFLWPVARSEEIRARLELALG